ncbi:hypothetical protein LAZ67_10001239, partial [Cordylochernes scorpioides]
MEDVSRRRREAIRGVFTEVVNDMNTELRNPLIDKSGIYAKFDRLEALYLELVVLNEQYQEILLAKAEATDDEIDKEFEECEVYIMERYYLKARIREMREQDRDAQAKTSQIPPGASSASPNSETNNQKVIKLQTTSTSLSKSPEESMKNEIEGVEKEDSVKTARATEVKPAQAKARMLREACSAPSIIDIEYEGKKGAMSAIKEKELNVAVKCNKVKDSETAVDSYVGVREAEAKNKANEAKAKPDKANLKGDGVNDSEAKPKGEGVKESEVNSKDGDKGDQVKESEGQKAGDEGDGKKDSEDEPKGDEVKDSEDEPKGDGVKDSKDEPKGDGVNDSEARPTGDTESKIKNRGDLQKLKGNPGDWLSRWGQFGRNNANEKYEDANLKDREDSEAKLKGDGVKDSETAIKGYEPVNNSRAVAEGADQVKISDETESIDDNEENEEGVVRVPASRKLVKVGPTRDAEFKIKDNYKETESQDLKTINKSDFAKSKDDKYNKGTDHDGNEAKNIDAEQGTDSTVGEKLDAEQGTDPKVEEKLDAEQGTDLKVEENLDAEQGTESKVEGYYWPRHLLFRNGSRVTPMRPVFGDASCREHGALALRRYLRRRPILLRRIPEIGIKLRKNKYGVLADMRRYFQEKIDGNPGKSIRAIAKEMDVGSMTIVRTIHEDLGLKSYALRKGQSLTENMKNNRKGKAAALLNNLKHDSFGMLRFFSDEKNFDVDQKVNPRNDRWICKDPLEIPVVMHTKFPASVMVLGVISSEGDVMPPHFFEKGLRMNADTYINVLETVVKPWMDMVAAGRKYVFQQDSVPAHKAKKTQSWLTLNVPSHWGPDIWPPNSPDCNPLDYYVWGVVERDVNKAPHTTIQSVKKAVHTVMTQMDKVIVAKACASFRTRLRDCFKIPLLKFPIYLVHPVERSEQASVLGMKWNLLEDTLNVTPKFGVIINSLSKRDLLSHTQQIFDPIGFLASVLLPAKLLIQQAWTVKIDWDEPLPSIIQESFMKWYTIHLELVTSLSTEAFIQALRRFIARRGRPTVIYSDNGTDFVGANNALKALNWKKIVLDQNLHKISWKFIPPTAAWWGGWWERLIRSIKDLLVRILGHSSVYYEEMSTILCDVEATINSRSLTYIHEDSDSLIPLSPFMFLHDSKYVGVPDLDKLDSKKFQDRYRHCQRLREALRSRFRSEYLGQLVQKANESTPKLSVGDVVIVKVEDKRRLHWPMARIVELFPGRDGDSR